MAITKQTTMEVYSTTAIPNNKVRANLRPVADPANPAPAMGGQDYLDFDAGTEPAVYARYTADTTYTPVGA